jgi:hypothetical protein
MLQVIDLSASREGSLPWCILHPMTQSTGSWNYRCRQSSFVVVVAFFSSLGPLSSFSDMHSQQLQLAWPESIIKQHKLSQNRGLLTTGSPATAFLACNPSSSLQNNIQNNQARVVLVTLGYLSNTAQGFSSIYCNLRRVSGPDLKLFSSSSVSFAS